MGHFPVFLDFRIRRSILKIFRDPPFVENSNPNPWPLESSESESGIKSYGLNTLIVLDSKGILVILPKLNHFISGPKLDESVEDFDTNPTLFRTSKFESGRKSYGQNKISSRTGKNRRFYYRSHIGYLPDNGVYLPDKGAENY